jgi:hypothetical protein
VIEIQYCLGQQEVQSDLVVVMVGTSSVADFVFARIEAIVGVIAGRILTQAAAGTESVQKREVLSLVEGTDTKQVD